MDYLAYAYPQLGQDVQAKRVVDEVKALSKVNVEHFDGEGKRDEALAALRAAADMEAGTEKHPVTPGPMVPARELLGELLLELNQPAQALKEFEATLRIEPGRFRTVYGAARAAELSGDTVKARAYYNDLVALGREADAERPELQRAKAFLAKP